MFVKIVIVLLLLIVAASLLVQRTGATTARRSPARLRPLMARMAFVLLALAAGAALLHFLAACTQPADRFHAQDITGADFGRLETLDGFVDHNNRRVTHSDFAGNAVVAFFGYTQCPDICPTTLATLRETMRLLGPAGDRVQVLFVTVDPERDTQAVLAEYIPWFDPRFLGLRADPDTTRKAALAFRVFYAKAAAGTALGYSIDHTAESIAYDPQGRLRLKIAHGADARQIAEDLSKLLAGK